MSGPPPKRQAERARANAPRIPVWELGPGDNQDDLPFKVDLAPVMPDAEDLNPEIVQGWEPETRELWDRLHTDPSVIWTGGAAMGVDLVMCHQLDRLLKPRVVGVIQATDTEPGRIEKDRIPLSGAEMSSLFTWLRSRGIYESDRLRLGKEVTFKAKQDQDKDEEKASVPRLTVVQNREELFKSSNAG